MRTETCIRVLIVDDHPLVRAGVTSIIERASDMTVAAAAANGQEALALFRRHKPDVVIMDMRLPDMDGTTAIAQIRQEARDARIVVLTAFDSEEDIFQSLQAGARAYLLKDTSGDDMLTAIRAVHNGQTYIPAPVAAKLAQRIGKPALTAREQDVLRLLVRGKSNQEIATILCIAEGTVKAHVNSILDKMQVNDRTQAVTSALRRGLARLD